MYRKQTTGVAHVVYPDGGTAPPAEVFETECVDGDAVNAVVTAMFGVSL
jgi:hypothetical protein